MCESRKLSDVKLGDKTIDHTSKGRRQADLMKFLQDEHKRYKAEILPELSRYLPEWDCGYTAQQAIKTEFLESLWDVISQHFDDLAGGKRT